MIPRVLVTSAGSTAGQNLLRFLQERVPDQFHTIAADCREDHLARDLAHENLTLPRGDDPGYVEALVDAVAATRADLVIPIMEPELEALATATSNPSFDLGCPLLMGSAASIRTSLSKRLTYTALEALRVPIPEQFSLTDAFALPVFVKPDRGTGSQGAELQARHNELQLCLAKIKDPVVEEVLDGSEFTLDGFADVDSNLIHFIARRRDEVRVGLATRTQIVEGTRFESELERIVGGLRLVGFFNVQCFEKPDGARVYIDVNPRLGGAMYLSFVGGLPPDQLIKGFLSGDYSAFEPSTRVGLRLIRRWENLVFEGT